MCYTYTEARWTALAFSKSFQRVSTLTRSRGIIMDLNPYTKTSGGGLDSKHGFGFCVLALGQEQPKRHRNNQCEIPRQFNHFQKYNHLFIPSFEPKINLKLDPHPVSFLLFSLILCLKFFEWQWTNHHRALQKLGYTSNMYNLHSWIERPSNFFLPMLCSEELHSSERKEDTKFQGRNDSVNFALFIKPSWWLCPT